MKNRVIVFLVGLALVIGCSGCTNNEASQKSEVTNKEKESDTVYTKQEPFSVEIAGVEYDFPMSYEEFKNNGWIYKDPERDDVSTWDYLLESGYSQTIEYDNGEIRGLEFVFENLEDEPVSLDKCHVVGINMNDSTGNVPAGSIVINGDVSIGESNMEVAHKSLGDDFSMEAYPDTDYSKYDIWVYYFNEDLTGAYMTMSFDDKGVFNTLTYLDAGK